MVLNLLVGKTSFSFHRSCGFTSGWREGVAPFPASTLADQLPEVGTWLEVCLEGL